MGKYEKSSRLEAIKQAAIMRGTGHTHQEIGDKLGVSRTTVADWLKFLKKESIENGVDETLTKVFFGQMLYTDGVWRDNMPPFAKTDVYQTGLVAVKIIQDLEWWAEYYKHNAHWLIIRLWEICNSEGEEFETLKKIILAALPAYCDDYRFDLEKYIEDKTKKVET